MAAPSTVLEPRVLPLHTIPLDRFERATSTLLSPLQRERDAWRQAVLAALRSYLDADRAVMVVRRGGDLAVYGEALPRDVVNQYLTHFAALDYGMERRDALGLTVWSREQLWDRRVLLRSRYFREFALPHDLHDSVGLSIDVERASAHVRVVMLYAGAPLPAGSAQAMRRRLELLLPIVRAGMGIHLRHERWLGAVPSVLDRIGERVLLLTLDGRELHRNVTMRRTLDEDPDRERILETAKAVGRAVAVHARGDARQARGPATAPRSTRRLVRTAAGRYCLRGCLMRSGESDADFAVLVSMEPAGVGLPSPEGLRDRFGLTGREIQVARLLGQRLTNDEIAATLGISAHTARHHTESILLKVGVNSRRSLRDAMTDGGEPR